MVHLICTSFVKFFFVCSTTNALSSSTAVNTFFWDCTTAVHIPKSLVCSCCSCHIGCSSNASLDSWVVPISWKLTLNNIHTLHFTYINIDGCLCLPDVFDVLSFPLVLKLLGCSVAEEMLLSTQHSLSLIYIYEMKLHHILWVRLHIMQFIYINVDK